MAKRVPPPGYEPPQSLPHDDSREGGQPYAKEVDDYQGGVAAPPEEQGRRDAQSQRHKGAGEDLTLGASA